MNHTSSTVYRIGIDARLFRSQVGGIGRYSRELIRNLADLDHVNEYYVFLTEADMIEWDCPNPNFFPILTPVGHYTAAEQTAFLRILNSYKLDLVHFLNFNHPVAYLRPFVVTLHDLTLLHKPEAARGGAKSAVKRKAFLFVFKHALQAAKRVIAISEFTAHDAERTLKLSHAKMEVIYEGAPVPMEIPFGSKRTVQDYLGTKSPYILFVSQWREHKGLKILLKAFQDFKEKYQLPYTLVLLGKQEAATPELRELLASSPVTNDIITPGFAPDEILPALYTYASAFVMPSEYEGFGLPVLEALSYGVPTVVANNTSLPEVGGDGVLYFETGNSSDLSEKLHTILTDDTLVQGLRAKGFKHAHGFRWDKAASQTLRVYQSILEKHR